MTVLRILFALVAFRMVVTLGWRLASRRWSLPCPTCLAWLLDHPGLQGIPGIREDTRPDWTPARPAGSGNRPGPGTGCSLPAAGRVLPGGEVIGIDMQHGMLERLARQAERKGITNLRAIHGDATRSHVPAESCDVVILCEVLGEIPDRAVGAWLNASGHLRKCGGVLSVTELLGDPHYQFRSALKRLAGQAGFRLQSIEGGWWVYTANFIKPRSERGQSEAVERGRSGVARSRS